MMKPNKWITAASVAAFGLVLMLAAPQAGAARLTLEHQTLKFQCGYKANLAKWVVDIVHRSQKIDPENVPNIEVRITPDSTEAEQAIIAQYVKNGLALAETDISPQDAYADTMAACMGALSVGWNPRKCRTLTSGSLDPRACRTLESDGRTKGRYRFIKARAPDVPHIVLPPMVAPPLNYQGEWCWNVLSDAKLIAKALSLDPNAGVQIHMNIETVEYFSQRRKISAHSLIESAKAAMASNTAPGAWFKQIMDACMKPQAEV